MALTRGPLSYMAKRLIELSPDGDWQLRYKLFRAGVEAIVATANHPALNAGRVYAEAGPREYARRVILRVRTPAIANIWQCLIYIISDDPAHNAAADAWQREHQAEVKALCDQHPEIDPAGGGIKLH
jgi:hypothetical protein